MQNKANLLDTQMSVSFVKTKYYENKRLCSRGRFSCGTKTVDKLCKYLGLELTPKKRKRKAGEL